MKKFFLTVFFFLLVCSGMQAQTSTALPADTVSSDSIWRSAVLDSVVVKGSNVVHRLDKDIWTFTDEMRKGTYDTNDILGKIPGFSYDHFTRQLTFLGDGKILLLIDGRERGNGFTGNLANIRFAKAEVSMSPTGRYQGYRAVVNLVTKEDWTGFDFNSSLHSVVAPSSQYGEKVSDVNPEVNYLHTGPRTDISLTSSYQHNNQGLNSHTDRMESNSVHYKSIDEGETTDWKYDNRYSLSIDIDYRLNKKHVLSAKYQYLGDVNHSGGDYSMARTFLSDAASSVISRTTRNCSHNNNHIWTVYYRGKLGKWSLYADASYDFQNHHAVYDFTEDQYVTSTDSRERRNIWRLNLNASKAYTNGSLSAGLSGNYRKYSVNASSASQESKHYEYESRSVVNVNQRLSPRITARIGGFLEPSYTKNMLGEREWHTLWGGNAYLGYDMMEKRIFFSLTYNVSVSYPRLSQMSSIRYQLDSLLYRTGNPNIRPTSIHNVELRGFYKNFVLSVSYDFSNNWTTSVFRNDGSQTVQTYANTTYRHLLVTGTYRHDIMLGKNRMSLEGTLNYVLYHRRYESMKPTNSSWGGYIDAQYAHHKYGMFGISYHSRSVTFNTLQGESRYRQSERWSLSYANRFAKGRLLVSAHYVLPVKWGLRPGSYSMTSTPFYSQSYRYDDFDAVRNSLTLTIRYRFAKGRQVKKLTNRQHVEKETVPDNQ